MTMDDFVDSGISVEISARPTTPSLPTPTGSKTPPTISRKEFGESSTNLHSRKTSEAMEADALSRRLKEFETAGTTRTRERTPGRSPSRKRQRVYGDRLVINSVLRIHSMACYNSNELVLETQLLANSHFLQIHPKQGWPGLASQL